MSERPPTPTTTPPAAGMRPDRLPPAPLTSFVGREREVAALLQLLDAGRLLSLTGAGGSGKTRLARELAARVAATRATGLAWVELAPLSTPGHLPSYVATALGVREEGADSLDAALGAGPMLLVLDNCEHVVEAAAAFAARHLERCPSLQILTTSREPLGVAGERAWLVPALSLPAAADASAVAGSEAGRLFVDRARDVLATFALGDANAAAVARICQRLDGIPLAIELAAARVRVLTPEKIAERLDDVFRLLRGGRTAVPRHRTLRETIRWSYDLLAPAERALLDRLSVFAGGFTLEATEAVCADAATGDVQVLDLLTALVDKSLVLLEVTEREPRYRLLETVRQYAAACLAADPEAASAVRRRHAAFYLALVEEAEPHVFVVDHDAPWLARLDAEFGNVAAAADWLEADHLGAEALLRLTAALDWYAYARGRFEFSAALLQRALARRSEAPPRAVVRALVALAHHRVWTDELPGAAAAAEDAIAAARTLGDPRLLSEALTALATAAAFRGEHDRALTLLREAEPLLQAPDHRRIFLLGVRFHTELRAGAVGTAVATGEAAFAAMRESAYFGAQAEMLPGFARALLEQGNHGGAARMCAAGVSLSHRSGRTWSVVHNLEALAACELASGDPARAAQVLGVADGLRDRHGMRLRPYADADARTRAAIRAALGPETLARLVAAGAAMSVDDGVAFAAGRPTDATGSTAAAEDAAIAALGPPAAILGADVGRSDPPPAPALAVHALGPVAVWRDGVPLAADDWKYARARELLLYLLAHPDGRTREQIGLTFWPDATSAQVKNSFHVLLHRLRKTLGRADLVALDGERYRIAWELGVEFDAAAFERATSAALRAAAGSGDDVAAVGSLRAAIAPYRGEFLADEGAGDWHLELRERLARLHAAALRALADRLERAEAWGEAAEACRALVRADPLNEAATRQLMRCLVRAGERGEAFRAYERLTTLLRTDLDAEPEPETAALHDRLRRAAGPSVGPAPAVADRPPTGSTRPRTDA